MTKRAIVFYAKDVNAILAGRKTQVRKVLRPQPWQESGGEWVWKKGKACWYSATTDENQFAADPAAVACIASHAAGDRLWVQETWRMIEAGEILYKANGEPHGPSRDWRLPSQMPQAASRISLEVTAVKIERLQDISEEDAIAEGPKPLDDKPGFYRGFCSDHATAKAAFQDLWDLDHFRHAWKTNPWVAAITFRRIA